MASYPRSLDEPPNDMLTFSFCLSHPAHFRSLMDLANAITNINVFTVLHDRKIFMYEGAYREHGKELHALQLCFNVTPASSADLHPVDFSLDADALRSSLKAIKRDAGISLNYNSTHLSLLCAKPVEAEYKLTLKPSANLPPINGITAIATFTVDMADVCSQFNCIGERWSHSKYATLVFYSDGFLLVPGESEDDEGIVRFMIRIDVLKKLAKTKTLFAKSKAIFALNTTAAALTVTAASTQMTAVFYR